MKKTIGTALLFLLVAAPAMAAPAGGGVASAGSHSFSIGPAMPVFSGGAQSRGNDPVASDPASQMKAGDLAQQDHFKTFPQSAKPDISGELIDQRPRCVMVPGPDMRSVSCVTIPQ